MAKGYERIHIFYIVVTPAILPAKTFDVMNVQFSFSWLPFFTASLAGLIISNPHQFPYIIPSSKPFKTFRVFSTESLCSLFKSLSANGALFHLSS